MSFASLTGADFCIMILLSGTSTPCGEVTRLAWPGTRFGLDGGLSILLYSCRIFRLDTSLKMSISRFRMSSWLWFIWWWLGFYRRSICRALVLLWSCVGVLHFLLERSFVAGPGCCSGSCFLASSSLVFASSFWLWLPSSLGLFSSESEPMSLMFSRSSRNSVEVTTLYRGFRVSADP